MLGLIRVAGSCCRLRLWRAVQRFQARSSPLKGLWMNGVIHRCGHDGIEQNLLPVLLWKRETGYCFCKSL